jgi:hypothetical protein
VVLSKNLPFRRNYEDYEKAFLQGISTILMVIDGETPDLARDASKALADRLGSENNLFKRVYVPGVDRFLKSMHCSISAFRNSKIWLTIWPSCSPFLPN